MARSNYCTIYIVRHAETEANAKGIFQGHTDYPLTKKGIIQAKDTAKKLKKIRFAAAFSSDLLRAKRTAQIIALEHKLTVKTTQALRERNFGIFEGKKYDEFERGLKEILHIYRNLPYDKKFNFNLGKGIENNEQIISRYIVFLREIAVAYRGKNILVVSHGGIMREFLIHLGSVNEKIFDYGAIKNGAYVKILSDGVDFFVKETWNVDIK